MAHSASHTIFPHGLKETRRSRKECFLNQKGSVIWLTGLSGSGKSTIAYALENALLAKGFLTSVLDGDNLRSGLCSDLTFSEHDRLENIRRVAEVAALFCSSGIITICSFISPTKEMRKLAKGIIGKQDFTEIYVNTPLSICEARDPKGLYKKARKGIIPEFTGISAPYEAPQQADILINTENLSIEACCSFILKQLQFE